MNSRQRAKVSEASHGILELIRDHDFLPSEVEDILAAEIKEVLMDGCNCPDEFEVVAGSRARALAREYINYAFSLRRSKDIL